MIVDVLKNISADKRSWDDGETSFFLVHLVLVVVSLTLGTIIGGYGIRALRSARGDLRVTSAEERVTLDDRR